MSETKQIDFIGIGAAKSGSSWLTNVLQQHAKIEIPARKELTYFNKLDITGIENNSHSNPIDYYLNFWDFSNNTTKGEFSPQYLSDEIAPSQIKKYFPDVKLIVILRNPVHRALSHFEYDQHFNAIIPKDLNFESAVKQFPYLLEEGVYEKHLQNWLKVFKIEQIKVIILEEAIEKPEQTFQDLFTFLGLDCPSELDFSAVNERKEIKSKTMAKLLKVPGKIDKKLEAIEGWKKVKSSSFYNALIDAKTYLVDKNAQKREKSEFPDETYQMLNKYYSESIANLESLLNLKLDHWR